MNDRQVFICILVAIVSGAAIMILGEMFKSPEEKRASAFRQCMHASDATVEVCKEVIGEAESNSSRP